MSAAVVCNSCGDKVPIPDGYAKGKIRCPACGVYCVVPLEARTLAAAISPPAVRGLELVTEPAGAAEAFTISLQPVAGPPAPLLAGTEEDDGQPYTVPGDPLLPSQDIKPEPPKLPFKKAWEVGWPLAKRAQVFCLLLALNLFTFFTTWKLFDSVVTMLGMFGFACGLQAFLLGTFDRIDLQRNARGKIRLTRSWRVAFVALPAMTPIRWSEFEGLITGQSHDPRFEDWIIMVVLLPYFVLPGALWWWYVIRPERFHVALNKDHGFPDTILFRATDRDRTEEVAQAVAETTGLPYNRPFDAAEKA